LEERIVLDAAVATANQHQTNQADQIQTADVSQTAAAPIPDQSHSAAGPDAASHGSENLSQTAQNDLHVVLVSNALDQIHGISDVAKEGARVAVINDVGDNLASVNRLLGELVSSTGQKIGELAILSHGTEGLVTLGSDQISAFNLSNFRLGLDQLSTLMTADAQIQLYGCSVAANSMGKGLVDGLAVFTGADVFASTDPTGGSAGNWTLEYASNSGVAMHGILDTGRLASIGVGLAAAYPAYQDNWGTAMGDVFYFVNDDGVHGKELWGVTKDGEPWMVKDINPGKADSNPAELTVYNDVLYFRATDGNNPTANNGIELWRSDGTAGGTYLVRDINPGGNKDGDPHWLTVSNGWLYFAANDAANGNELFRYNSIGDQLQSVKDINLGNADSNPSHLTDVNGTVFFSADDGTHGVELWKSNGTEPGTVMVKDINNEGNQNSNPDHLVNANGTLFFSATTKDEGNELWKSNGAEAGTVMVKDINPGKPDSNPAGLMYTDGAVYFSASDGNGDGSHGTELWKSVIASGSTSMVMDINPGLHDSNPTGFTVAAGAVYFSADDGTHGTELWKSVIASGATSIVMDINPGADSSSPRFFNNYDNDLIFAADDGTHGYEPWKYDHIADQTSLVQDINPAGSSFPLNFARLNPLFFLADDGHGFKLWKSDGTVPGTVKVSDVATGSMVESSGGQPAVGPSGQTAQTGGGNQGSIAAKDAGASLLTHILSVQGQDTRLFEATGKSVPLHSILGGTLEAAPDVHPGGLKGAGSPGQAESPSHEASESMAAGPLPGEPGYGAGGSDAGQDQDVRPIKWDQPLPGMIKVVVLENGDYSVRTDVFALVVGAEVWTPPMVRWYLSALSEGRYRPGSLPSGFERMVWDFLQYSAGRKTEGKSPLSEIESKLAWQWAEWRRQLARARGNVDVLPWDYFKGLSEAMILFYGAGHSGDVDFAKAVNAIQQNIRNLTIIPIRLPDELLSKATEEPSVK